MTQSKAVFTPENTSPLNYDTPRCGYEISPRRMVAWSNRVQDARHCRLAKGHREELAHNDSCNWNSYMKLEKREWKGEVSYAFELRTSGGHGYGSMDITSDEARKLVSFLTEAFGLDSES